MSAEDRKLLRQAMKVLDVYQVTAISDKAGHCASVVIKALELILKLEGLNDTLDNIKDRG